MALLASFAGKRVLVTGGANGLGRKLVERLSQDNATVFALDKSEADLKRLKTEFAHVNTLISDLSDWDNTKKIVESIGTVDHLVNTAGFMKLIPFFEITEKDFKTAMDVNLRSVIQVSQIVAKGMIENKIQGTIVNVSSVATKCAARTYVLYGASKAGVTNFTRNLAMELAPYSIRVNCVCPGPMDTNLLNADVRARYLHPEKGFIKMRSPIRRLVQPEEAADLILFLLSPLSAMINGEDVFIDGGIKIT